MTRDRKLIDTHINLDEDLIAEIQRIAAKEDRKPAVMIRVLLREAIQKRKGLA
jgi:hypothetical protein